MDPLPVLSVLTPGHHTILNWKTVEKTPLVPTYASNSPSFTSVHSHAHAPKSSGAFFSVWDRERVPETARMPQDRAEGLYGGAAKRCYGKSGHRAFENKPPRGGFT